MARICLSGVSQSTAAETASEEQGTMAHAWSDEQVAIFDWFAQGAGNLVVRARAGTGKTATILEATRRAPERQILLAAFNKIIAEELQSRAQNPAVDARTLHALGFTFVRANLRGVRVDNRRKWDLANEVVPRNTPQRVLRSVVDLHTLARETNPGLVHLERRSALDWLIELGTTQGIGLLFEEDDGRVWDEELIAQYACDAMHAALQASTTIDFADMIFLPLARGWVTPRYDLVIVDEAQDMSHAQLDLAQRVCRRTGRIAVVGDDRQAIYGFRGADSGSLDRLKRQLDATERGLKTTYRCPQKVVSEAQAIVSDFVAAPTAPEGIVRECTDVKDTLVREAAAGDFVLSRTNAPLVPLCLALLKANKLARIRGRDLSVGLRKLVERIESRSETRSLDALFIALDEHMAAETKIVNARVDRGALHAAAAETVLAQLADQHAVLRALSEGVGTFAELYERLTVLFTAEDYLNAVMLSTVHRAKGLESERVWLLHKTFLRTARDADADVEPEEGDSEVELGWRRGREEKNIRYVAITRSKRELIWLKGDCE